MAIRVARRSVLTGSLAVPWLLGRAAADAAEEARPAAPTLDIHLHLFGAGDGDSGCRLAPAVAAAPTFQLLTKALRLRERAKTLDEGYVLVLAEQLQHSGLQKGLILAQDAVYDRAGKPDWAKTPFYVPNDYLLQVVARYPQWMVPCVSINPDRADALAELDRCADKGARALKIHPPIQGVDVADKKHTRFFQRCAAFKFAVLVHTGHEHSSPIIDVGLADPRKLELALDQGCAVVACHCGTGRTDDRPDMLPDFLAMTRKYKNLWGDTSVLGGLGRARDFLRLLADQPVAERLLHGSDFPFPAMPMAFAAKIGQAEALRIGAITNMIRQDFELKEALGIGRASAERAHRFVQEAAAPGDRGATP
jgi:predicted TIM-barrel fold metal-dependent hydrolase